MVRFNVSHCDSFQITKRYGNMKKPVRGCIARITNLLLRVPPALRLPALYRCQAANTIAPVL